MKADSAVQWHANGYGYQVEVMVSGRIVHEYFAGNHPNDSEECLEPDDPFAVPEPEIRKFAQSTAERLAEEFKIPVKLVSEFID